MPDRDRSLRDEMERRLLALGARLPTSSLGRLGRTALTALRGGRFAWRGRRGGEIPLDVDALAAIVASVGQLKGIAMKAGQLVSYLDLQLPPELSSALAVLQTHSPPMPFERVAQILKDELADRASPLLARMDPAPAAALATPEIAVGLVGAAAVIAFILTQRNRLVLALLSADIARTAGIDVARLDLFYLLAFAVTVGLGLRYLGVLLMGSLIIIPAATAKLLARNLSGMLGIAVAVAVLATVAGEYAAARLHRATGPVIITIAAGLFFVGALARRR